MKKTSNIIIVISVMAAVFLGCSSSVMLKRAQPQIKIETRDEVFLKFLDVAYKVSGDELVIEGKIGKTSSRMLPGIFVTAKFYDSENKIIDVKVQHTIRNIRKRRRKSRYSIKVDYSPQIMRCTLEVDWHKQ